MEYVMVPVPAELRTEVKRVIAEIGIRDYMTRWSEEDVAEVVDAAEPAEIDVLRAVIDAQAQGELLRLNRLAEQLDKTVSDAELTITALNRRANEMHQRTLVLVGLPAEEESGPETTSIYLVGTNLDKVAAALGIELTEEQRRIARR